MKWYSKDADYIESRMVDLNNDPRDLWQDRLIYGILKVLWDILKWIKKQEEKNPGGVDCPWK